MVLFARALSVALLTAALVSSASAGSPRRNAHPHAAAPRSAHSTAHARSHISSQREKGAAHRHLEPPALSRAVQERLTHPRKHDRAFAVTEASARHRSRRRDASHFEPARTHRQSSGTARLMPVVRVIRPTAQRPQLPAIADAVEQPLVLPTVLDTHGRLVMPPPLRGSREILLRQNQVASDDGLGRIQDDTDLDGMRRRGMLVSIPETAALHVDDRLPDNRRVCRPWTEQFLANLSRAHYNRFHTPLQLTSAVRTVAFQQHLQHINGNAAPAEGETASPHLTGQAVDLGKKGLSLPEIAWLRGYLLPLIEAGKVDVEEEFRQSCFHISVYRTYGPSLNDINGEHLNVASRALTPAATEQ